ncbi:hypothetical protein M408DRAFT_12642 [Serendipita vermifera MAFF 305830]|uniref:Uncharacterized protein n=1 Tax=Serendipita vermifera MAFF 305830 TaxID=933852 RepID=A0A0C2W4A9_SERVB|nr:hypothetical protein M408DRAFT_12642 [Serendipita vermifera MAFF 305830]
MCWRTTYTDNFGCGCIDVKVRPGLFRTLFPISGFGFLRSYSLLFFFTMATVRIVVVVIVQHIHGVTTVTSTIVAATLEFPEGCAPCITKRLIAEEAEENARNGGR